MRTVNAQRQAEPFYLERTVFAADISGDVTGTPSLYRMEIVARRSDGTTARLKSMGPFASPPFVRDVTFLDGRHVTLFDSIKVRTTWPQAISEELGGLRQALIRSPRDCGASPPIALVGFDHVGDLEVAVKQSIIPGKFRVTRWAAPKLGCEALYDKSEALQKDGSFRIAWEAKVSQLTLDEPDPRLFDIGEDFSELTPSEGQRLLVRGMGLRLPPAEERQLEREGREADRQYRAAPVR